MSTYLPESLRQRLVEVDGEQCAYCQTTQANSGHPMVVDHITPRSRGGLTDWENLCFSCHRCNEFKGPTTELEDPLTGVVVPLFHPRQQRWHDHFTWDDANTRIAGLTAVGRATIVALKMNNEVIVEARRRWVSVGWHPPQG